MKNDLVRWLCVGACAGVLGSTAIAAPPPISAFARLEQVKSPALSPDGRYLLYISQSQGDRVAAVTDLTAAEPAAKVVLAVEKENEFDMTWCRWANDTRVLCAFQAAVKGRIRVGRQTRLVAVNADGSDMKLLRQDTLSTFSTDQDNVLDMTPDDPDTILVQTYDSSRGMPSIDSYPSVYELNIYTGQLRKQTNDYRPIRAFYSDGQGNVRLGRGLVGTTYKYYARLEGEKQWRALTKVEAFEATDAYVPIAVVPGTNSAYAFGPSGDRRGLYKIDLEDKAKPELIFEHPHVDVANAVRTADGRLIGVFYEVERPFAYFTDERLAGLMRSIRSIFPETFNVPVSASKDLKRMVIASRSDTEAGSFFLLDMETRKPTRIGRMYPELDPEQLPRMRYIEYKASDGVLIPAYLTAPAGVRAEKLPLIVMPHGGPRSRDSWRFDFLRHFLASRGYAVLQMNFRGSIGYGNKWFADAFQDWGGVTYSDIADGARWAAAAGVADPQRICIVGWSFGGYSALVGATRNPDLFKCAASIAGISDLVALRAGMRGAVNSQVAQLQIGDDKSKLRTDSPIERVKDVQMPVLLIHGTLDAQAPYEQSKDMAAALKRVEKPHTFITIENADHALVRESERVTLLSELEKFLASSLGPGKLAANY